MSMFYSGPNKYTRIDSSNAFMPVDANNAPTVQYNAPLDPPNFGGPSCKDGELHTDSSNNIYRYDEMLGAWILTTSVNLVTPELSVNSNGTVNFTHEFEKLVDNFDPNPRGISYCQHSWKRYVGFTESYDFCEKCNLKGVSHGA